jgi:acetone carboxylase gamma subunit
MDKEQNKEQIKKLYTQKSQDIFITKKEDVVNIVNELVFSFIDTYKIENPFKNDEDADKFVDSLFNKLLFDDSIVVEIGDKSLMIEKKEIISKINNN